MLYLLVSTEFQVLFHSPPGVLFTFPSQYFALSVIRQYLGLEGGPPVFPPDSTCPAVLWILPAQLVFRIQGFHLLRRVFPHTLLLNSLMHSAVLTPKTLLLLVWPVSLSLATTQEISVDFFSSPYLDVSVRAVPLPRLFDLAWDDGVLRHRISPFGLLRVIVCLRLTAAYRCLPRPSSAPNAKASTLRSF